MASPASFSNLFQGQITHLSHGLIEGWVVSNQAVREKRQQNVWLHVLVDGQEIERIACNLPRPEEAALYHFPTYNIGFQWQVPAHFLDGKKRRISLRFPDRSILPFPARFFPEIPSGKDFLEEWIFEGKNILEVRSHLDGIQNGHLVGWVTQRKGLYGSWNGNAAIEIYADGRPLTRLRANRQRIDVAQNLKRDNFSDSDPDPACGFKWSLPPSLCDGRPHHFRVFTLPHYSELLGSPLRTKCLTEKMAAQITNLNNMLDVLQTQLTHLIREARALIPQEEVFSLENYERWFVLYEKSLSSRLRYLREEAPFLEQPLLSVICPVFKPEERHFQEAVESVLGQTYKNWELLIVLDGKQPPEILSCAKKIQNQDKRIKLFSLPKHGGISQASNLAIKKSAGEYLLFLDHDDLLVKEALEIMLRAAQKSNADVLYSDEDQMDPNGFLHTPHLKPDFNYRYLLGCNYICHLTMYRRNLLEKIGGLKKIYDGAQDHELLLRAYEISPNGFFHVPEILYHWRQAPNSTALSSENKKYAKSNGAKAVRHHLERQGIKARVTPFSNITFYKIKWTLPANPPPVTVIIPMRDLAQMTGHYVRQFLKSQSYPNFSILLIDNWSIEQETEKLFEEFSKDPRISILRIEEDFNFSRLNNLAVEKAKGNYLLFLNNDVEVKQKDFLSNMMGETLNLPQAGAVGACLFYPSSFIQHAGVAVGPEVVGLHVHQGIAKRQYGYMARAVLNQELSAVTGAAMLVKKEVFLDLGGFDEENLPIAFNDVDFCLRLRKKGYRIYYCAESKAIHHESLSRGSDEHPWNEGRFFKESQYMKAQWGEEDFFQKDPFYPKNFTLEGESFFYLRRPERD